MARAITTFFLFFIFLSTTFTSKIPDVDYDVIVVGGGPAGLSATSALCRVARKVIMFDSEEYRNAPTRRVHDVIGHDGIVPADFRAAARAQILKYDTVVLKNAKIVDITHNESPEGLISFVARDQTGHRYKARRVVLATGVTDVLPSTPGILNAFGQGMYWCPWCDGYEHRGQSLAVLGPLNRAPSAVLELHNMNSDIIIMANGTDTPEERRLAFDRSHTWQAQLAAYNIPIINITIESITRLRDNKGHPVSSAKGRSRSSPYQHELALDEDLNNANDNSGPQGKYQDLFRVNFIDGSSIERAAFLINTDICQTSDLPRKLTLAMNNTKIHVDARMQTNYTGIFAVGDANDDGSTNVLHAMYTGKKAAVIAHVALAQEESMASISKSRNIDRSIFAESREKIVMQTIGDELEELWERTRRYLDTGS